MTTEPLTTNTAKDHTTEFERYPTYSLAVLWSMKALTPDEFEAAAVSDTPLDGDAIARTRFQELKLAEAWDKLNAAAIDRFRHNHHKINRTGRDG
jgi:hypothetical protein